MEELQQLQPVELTHLFNMKLGIGPDTRFCEVYKALLADGATFTRVIMCPSDLTHEKVIDLDHHHGEWVDMYTWEPSPWTSLVTPCLDFQIQFRENLLRLHN